MATTVENTVVVANEEALHCFVCDVAVSGRYYTLATCRTQSTKIRLIEKLGQLVGERYMVVVSEDDIICRGCANLMNTLDRLESEMGSVRSVVLRFLEKKYSLEEGELINNKSTGLSQPPQITPSRHPSSLSKPSPDIGSENFMSRKRKAALSDIESEQENSLAASNKLRKGDGKNNMWMQCDKCKYTTHYNAFMIHHIRQHVKKKPPTCDYCGDEVKSGSCARHCGENKIVASTSSNDETASPSITPAAGAHFTQSSKSFQNNIHQRTESELEAVEMMAAELSEIGGPNRAAESADVVISTVQTGTMNNLRASGQTITLPTITEVPEPSQNELQLGNNHHTSTLMEQTNEMTIEVSGMTHEEVSTGNVEVQMENPEESAPTAICVMNMSEENSAEEPTLLTVQKMEDDSNAVYVQVVEVGKTGSMDDPPSVTKQVLTVSDDGTVEMVEVMWDEMVTPDVETEQNINF